MNYHIYQVKPEGYIHAEGLNEFAETVYYGLKRLGFTVTMGPLPAPHSIVIGAHLASTLPPDAIIYNSEQIHDRSPWLTENYLELLRNHTVWDYSSANVRKLKELGVKAKHIPIGYVPELTRIKPQQEDIDVLFFGSMNERRTKIIDELKAAGLKVETLFGVYGAVRDSYIARSKIVLNIHFYDVPVFEIVRVSYLLANRKCVVSETTDGSIGVRGVFYDEIVKECVDLAGNAEERAQIALDGFNAFSEVPEEKYLERAVKSKVSLKEYEILRERYVYACTAGIPRRKLKTRNRFDIVVPVNDLDILDRNIRASPGLTEIDPHIICVSGATSAADAWEKGKTKCKTDWILYCHQDIAVPEGSGWMMEHDLLDSRADVLGFAGIVDGEHAGFVIDRGWRFDHPHFGKPTSIEEFAVFLRPDVTLDPDLGWHCWGTDLCHRYRCALLRIPLFHNSIHGNELPPEYIKSTRVLRKKYPERELKTLNGVIDKLPAKVYVSDNRESL